MKTFKKMSSYAPCVVIILFALMVISTVMQYLPLPIPGTSVFMIFLLSFFLFSLTHSIICFGWRSAWVFVGITFIICLLFELIGVATGMIYGRYHYADFLGYKFFNLVPFYIPLAWFMMIYASYDISGLILPKDDNISLRRHLKRGLLFSAVMTSWDLSMDPRLSTEWGLWVWIDSGPWFGVPIQNYIGWLITAGTIYIIYGIYNQHVSAYTSIYKDSSIFTHLPAFSYMVMAVNEVVASLMIGRPLLAAAAILSMGSFSTAAICSLAFRPQKTSAHQ